MSSLAQALLVAGISVIVTLLMVFLVRSNFRGHRIRGSEDPETVYIPVLSTIYAIFLAFMIFVVWTRFYEAMETVDREADAVIDIYGLAEGLPGPQRTEIQKFCVDYVNMVLKKDWNAMDRGTLSMPSQAMVVDMWTVLGRMNESGDGDEVVRVRITERWTDLADYRRSRLLYSRIMLPGILYAILLIGGVITIASAAIFAAEDPVVHALKAGLLALIISLMLYSVFALDRPFQGSVQVSPVAFERAREVLAQGSGDVGKG